LPLDERRGSRHQGLVNQAIADLLEDPEQMRKLVEIARFKPTLRLVHNRDSEDG
jgi:hypothetical protein